MKIRLFLLSILVLNLALEMMTIGNLGFAANPPDKSKILLIEPQNVGHIVHVFEISSGRIRPLLSVPSAHSQFVQWAVLDSPSGPVIYGTTHSDRLLVGKANTPIQGIYAGFAIAQISTAEAIVAGRSNALYIIDALGNMSSFVAAGWLPEARYGQIRHVQLVNPHTVVVGTDKNDIVVASFMPAPAGPLNLISMITAKVGGRILQVLDGGTFASITHTSATLAGKTDLCQFAYNSSPHWAPATQPVLLGVLPLEMIGVKPITGDLLARTQLHYVRIDSTGVTTDEATGYFHWMTLVRNGLPSALVHHNGIAGFLAPPPMQGQRLGSAPVVSSVPAAPIARRPVFEPLEASDFFELARREASANNLIPLTVDLSALFFSQWINATTTLRYYFKRVPSALLGRFGLRFQVDSLVVIAGMEQTPVGLGPFVHALSEGAKVEQAEIEKARVCALSLGERSYASSYWDPEDLD